jgi:hypothetical protein
MKTTVLLLFGTLAALAVLLSACSADKGPGAPDLFASNATKLYFSDCDPFTPDQESTDLVFDASDACTGNIEFPFWFGSIGAEWKSNAFRVQPGTYYEGCHLRFVRNMTDAEEALVLHVAFNGLAVSFLRRIEIPVRETSLVVDLFEEGTVTLPAGTMAVISVQITDSSGSVALDPSYGVGSYVMTGADQATVCRFEIDLGLAHGLGYPNQGVNFAYVNAVSAITDTLAWDFTAGARLLPGPVLQFGPRFGVAYLTAESGGCLDSASFWSLPGEVLEETTLASMDSFWYQFISDGDSVWLWQMVSNTGDSLTPYRVRITSRDGLLRFTHPVHGFHQIRGLFYDQTRDLIWILQTTYTGLDTAWGYTTTGVLDTFVSFSNIPQEGLYRGQWLQTTATGTFFRETELFPLNGGPAVSSNTYPIELTRQFSGGAGVGYPGFAAEDSWTINVFDSLGNWFARQRVNAPQGETIDDVRALSSDRRIVYALYTYNASYTHWVHVRVLHP